MYKVNICINKINVIIREYVIKIKFLTIASENF